MNPHTIISVLERIFSERAGAEVTFTKWEVRDDSTD